MTEIKTLSYPVSTDDFEALTIGDRVKLDMFFFQDGVFELCLTGSDEPRLAQDVVCSASDNGTELRLIRDI